MKDVVATEIKEKMSNVVVDRVGLRVHSLLEDRYSNTFKISDIPDMDPATGDRSDVLRVQIPRFGGMQSVVGVENGFGNCRETMFCEISEIRSKEIVRVMNECKLPPVIAVHLMLNKGMSFEEVVEEYGVRKDEEKTPILIGIYGPSMQGKSLASGIFCTANNVPLIDLDGFVEKEGAAHYSTILEGIDWKSKKSSAEALERVKKYYEGKGESSWSKTRPNWNVWMALDKLCEDYKQICSGEELPELIICDMHGFRLSENEEEMRKWNPLDLMATEALDLTFEAAVNYGTDSYMAEPEINSEVMDLYRTMLETVIFGDQKELISAVSDSKRGQMIAVLEGNESVALDCVDLYEYSSMCLDLWMNYVYHELRDNLVET